MQKHRRKIKDIFAALLICAALAVVAVWHETAEAETTWNAVITASYGYDSNKLILGAAADATDDFENGYEARAILAGYLMAYFYHPEWVVDTPYFWTDVKDTNLPKEWTFYISSSYTNKTITMKWELSNVPDTLQLSLIDDLQGTAVDMKAQSSYAYMNTSAVARTFRAQASGSIGATDTTPPDTAITTQDIQFIKSSGITISYTGSDDISVPTALRYSYRIDSGDWSAWAASATASLTGLSEGVHTFYVKAKDEAGNEDQTPAAVGFTVDTIAPVIVLNQPNPSVLWPPKGRMMDVTVSGNVKDNGSGLASVFYTVNDEYGQFGLSGSVSPQNDGAFSFVISLKAERRSEDIDGRIYTIIINAVDKAGNFTSSSINVIVPHDRR